jgi:hypothetical protein
MPHLSEAEVMLFVDGRLAPDALRGAVRHLLGCRRCRQQLSPYGGMPRREAPPTVTRFATADPGEYGDHLFDGALLAAQSHWEREEAPVRLKFVALARTLGITRMLTRTKRTRYEWARVMALLDLSYEERYRDLDEMRVRAYLATQVATHVSSKRYGAPFVADLQARAMAELGNAHRVAESYREAEQHITAAFVLATAGSHHPALLGRIYDLRASLESARRDLEEAFELLETARYLYVQAGEAQLEGKVLIKLGTNTIYDERPAEAVPLLRQGLAQLDLEADPQLFANGQQVLFDALSRCGEYHEAARFLLASGLRQTFADDPLGLAKIRWGEGRVQAGLGKLTRAEKILRGVEELFLARNLKYEAALVGLERAEVLLEMRRWPEVQALAAEIYTTVCRIPLRRQARKAIQAFEEACRQQTATVLFARRVARFLRQLEWQPHLRFSG